VFGSDLNQSESSQLTEFRKERDYYLKKKIKIFIGGVAAERVVLIVCGQLYIK